MGFIRRHAAMFKVCQNSRILNQHSGIYNDRLPKVSYRVVVVLIGNLVHVFSW